ncbi:acid protease [Venturia nashicola]|uniref:Acid protease n=1 Tax=Venturia nashicola TaxID=86259 RepID=A0A4Z1PA39_9PEZI|nr:acid protease [Venturia nashicola]TLD29793.1 acid protease [Venturia nashicola]
MSPHLSKRARTVPAPLVVRSSQSFEGGDGDWSTFNLAVGTPPQSFHVLPSTKGSETWVPVPEGCTTTDPPNCPSIRGVQPFNGNSPSGFLINQSTTWEEQGLYAIQLDTALNYKANGHYGKDVLALNGGNGSSGGVSLPKQMVAGIAAKDYLLGILGLGIQPTSFSSSSTPVKTFMDQLKDNRLIPSLSYGYTAGASYQQKGVLGSLILGGYDSSRFKPDATPHSFSFGASDANPLKVGVQSIVADNTLVGTTSLSLNAGHLTVVDSTVPHIWLPRAVCDRMEAAFGLIYDSQSDLYTLNNTMHAQLQALNPSITFKIGDTAYDNGNGTNIRLPYGAFDLKVGWPTYSEDVNYFPIRRANNETQYTLGRTLLQEAYIVVDYERRNFSLYQTTFSSPLPPSRIVTIQPKNALSSPSSGISTGAIAGIVVAGVILAILAIAASIWFLRKRREKNRPPELDGNGNSLSIGHHDRKIGHKAESGLAEMDAEGQHQILELGQHQILELGPPMVDRKERPHNFATELPQPAEPTVYYEMDADSSVGGGEKSSHGQPSPLINRNLMPDNGSQPPSAVSPPSSTCGQNLGSNMQSGGRR